MHATRGRQASGRHRIIAFCLLLVPILIASCGNSGEEFDLAEFAVAEDLSLSYWMPLPSGTGTRIAMERHRAYQELESVTGVRIEFIHPIVTQPQNQLALLRESDDLPDIIEWNWLTWYPGGPEAAIEDGMILPLRDLVIQHAPNLFKVITEDEQVSRAVSTPTGELYAFPHLARDAESRTEYGLMIRGDWLDQLEIPVPDTIDQWRNMMLAMRDSSFDTPGRGAEYPFFFPVFRGFGDDDPTYFFFDEANPFAGAWGVSHGFLRDDDGRVVYGPVQPGYRDMLAELHSWYADGLINPSLAEAAGGRSLFDVIAKSGATVGSYGFMAFLRPIDYVTAPPPALDDSPVVGAGFEPVYNGSRSAAVAASTEHPVEAVRWLDVAYSGWGKRLLNFGIEGESYELVDGEPVLLDSILDSYVKSLGGSTQYSSALSQFSRALLGGPFEESGALVSQLRSRTFATESEPTPWVEHAVEPVDLVMRYDRGRSEEFNRIMEPIISHARASFTAFVIGQRPLDEFDRFVSEIEALGLNEAISIIYLAESEFYAKPVW